jgi:hypothetical protein
MLTRAPVWSVIYVCSINQVVYYWILSRVKVTKRSGFGLVTRFIGSSLAVTTTGFYTLSITISIIHVTSHTKSSNSSSSHSALPLELRKSIEINSNAKVTLPLTVSHSESLGVEPRLDLMIRYLLLFDISGLVFLGALSLTRGRVCLFYMLLALTSVVFLERTSDRILLSPI